MKVAEFDVALHKAQSLQTIADALDFALQQGATTAEASIVHSRGAEVTVRMGETETIEYEDNQAFSITVYCGNKRGSASSSDTHTAAVKESVKAACEVAKYVREDKYAGIAEPELLLKEVPDLSLDHPWQLGIDRMKEIALECEDAARTNPKIINSEGANVKTQRGVTSYGNSNGFLAATEGTIHEISCIAVAGADNEMQRDFWFTLRRDPHALQTPQAVGERAAKRAVERLGARKIKGGKVPVLFPPQTARNLIGCFFNAIDGAALYRGTSFLLDSLHTQVFPEWLSIDEEPLMASALYSSAYDDDGVATYPHALVADGVVMDYVLDVYSARKLGLKTTANAGGVRNPILRGPAQPYDALLEQMGEGLVASELIGSGVNPITGDYSQGVAGFWVEGGKIAYPVGEITLAGNLKDMFASIVGIGQDIDEEGNIRCGSIVVEGMTVAGV